MKPSFQSGLTSTFRYRVPMERTVPYVYPESELFQGMPRVFATAYLVGLIEWACIEAMQPHFEPGEQSVGTDIRVNHTAATPPGFEVEVQVTVDRVEGRRAFFSVRAHDGVETISEGTHERVVIDAERFRKKMEQKAAARGRP
ncbi:MAG TPA: thioesterase family protein [Myxococcaceae bacterium]|nr:thioesterase family protein [Myxococcaceae bacterium]